MIFWGRIFFHLLWFRRSIVLKNLTRVFGKTKSKREIRFIAYGFYAHVVRFLWEMLLLRCLPWRWLARRVEVKGFEHLQEAEAKGRGVLLLTGHFGNWEFAPVLSFQYWTQLQNGIYAIRKSLSPAWLEQLLFRRYQKAGLRVLNKDGAFQSIPKCLKEGATVSWAFDQHSSTKNREGVRVDFLDRPAGTYRSLALVEKRYKSPVVPMRCYRKPCGGHVMEFFPALTPMGDESITERTEAFNRVLSRFVLERPTQWWWFHRRWKAKS